MAAGGGLLSFERQPLLSFFNRTAAASQAPPLVRRPSPGPMYSCITNPLNDLPVYTNIHRIRRDIISVVEDFLSDEQLRDVRINITVIRPLVDKLYDLDDISVVYCLLVNRAQFLEEQSHHNNRHNVNFSRASLCELIATRILRRFSDRQDGPDGLILLAQILVAGFEPFQGAPDEVRHDAQNKTSWLSHRTLPALEVAILTESKYFLSSTSCQKVIDAVYKGKIVYTPSTFLDIIPDHYKQKPISLYDPREAPLLNQYRLLVPRTRNILEALNFVILLCLYLAVMAYRDPTKFGLLEACFAIYAFGWVLDQFATMLEHGWHVYTQHLWSFLDVGFTGIYGAYVILRTHGWQMGSIASANQALDILGLGAMLLIPRLAFNLLSDNLVFLSLRSMMADFLLLTAISVWCFVGFLLALFWLGDGNHSPVTISKWMLWIWFGLDGTGINRSVEFHWLLGPCVMVAFAFLGNTLFLTILVAMLTNTFSKIASNATAEMAYRLAIVTLEGVKADAIFAYMPPFNILAVLFLVPLKFVVSPRWFHKIHVASVRIVNLPLLLIIAVAERRLLWSTSSPLSGIYSSSSSSTGSLTSLAASLRPDQDEHAVYSATSSPAQTHRSRIRSDGHGNRLTWRGWDFWRKWRISPHRDLQAVFSVPTPDSVLDDIAVDDELTHHLIRRQFTRRATAGDDLTLQQQRQQRDKTNSNGESQNKTNRQRRDSTFPGIARDLRESFHESGAEERLAALEATMARVEVMLARLLPSGDDASSGGSTTRGEKWARDISDQRKRADGQPSSVDS